MAVFEMMAFLGLDKSGFDEGLDDAQQQSSSIGGAIGGTLGNAVKAGAVAITAATGATVGFAKSAVDVGMNFDAAMSQVAATMGVTTDEITDLRDFAKEMGASTMFSATEAAEALNYMALAGYDTQQSMDMLPTVLNLAAAGGMDLATASDMITDAQTALGLSFEETAVMVDQMAKASSKTNTSVEQLGDAFLTVGANAKSMAGGTEEMASVLGVLADNGIKGTEAGTHLRNILLKMNPDTDAAKAAWEKLGISTYDAEGNLRDLRDIFGELSVAMADMTSQERDQMLKDMFNTTDLASVNALLDTSAERWEELGYAMDEAGGAAEEMAETQMDNLQGALKYFGSALEGVQLIVSEQLSPALTEFVNLGTQGLSAIVEGFNENGIEGVMEAVGNTLNDAIGMVSEMLPKAVEAGATMLTAIVEGLAANVPMLAESATQIMTSFVEMLINTVPGLLNASAAMIAEMAKGIGESLPELVPAAVEAVLSFTQNLIDNTDAIVDGAISLITGLGIGLINSIPILLENVPKIIQSLVEAIVSNIPKLGEAGHDLLVALISDLPGITADILVGVLQLLDSIAQACFGGVAAMVMVGYDLIMGIGEGIGNAAGSIIDKVKSFGSNVIDAIKGVFGIHSPSTVFSDIGKNLMEGLMNGISSMMDTIRRTVSDFANGIIGTLKGVLGIHSPSKVMEEEIGQNIGLGVDKGIRDEFSAISKTAGDMSSLISVDGDVNMAGGGSTGRIEALLVTLIEAVQSSQVTLDGKAVVGYLGPEIDKELGRILTARKREASYTWA